MVLLTMFVHHVWPKELICWPKAIVEIIGSYAMGGILLVRKNAPLCIFHVQERRWWILGTNHPRDIVHMILDNNKLYCQTLNAVKCYNPQKDAWEILNIPGTVEGPKKVHTHLYQRCVMNRNTDAPWRVHDSLAFDFLNKRLWGMSYGGCICVSRDTWASFPRFPHEWDHDTCVIYRGNLFAFNKNAAMMLDINKPKWQRLANMPYARFQSCAVVYWGRIFLIGGVYPTPNEISCYDPFLDKWVEFQVPLSFPHQDIIDAISI